MIKTTWKLTLFTLLIALMTASVATAQGEEPGKTAAVQTTAEHQTVFINQLIQDNGELYIDKDPIQWYEGAAADKAFKENEPDNELDGAPDGYYIVNTAQDHDKIKVAPDAKVLMQIFDHTGKVEDVDVKWNEVISLAQFEAAYHKTAVLDLSQFPYHLTIENGVVTEIVQQYIP
ncbi:hypothetical protein Q5741_04515 [Paenibacillus sp. JX-17]|uniref:Copper amine oxidase-like N-terminal domain-containing protein n=1 Tax=Paenibacillus lacisoli TaxID=3064525 RepID=A0ABT9C8U1_9BACL|nr:hypothetical protein [Paenibacillus sp. JX-17]MDO7905674.1 hypothetical protein [Paenibacillus sp. JX-17]